MKNGADGIENGGGAVGIRVKESEGWQSLGSRFLVGNSDTESKCPAPTHGPRRGFQERSFDLAPCGHELLGWPAGSKAP